MHMFVFPVCMYCMYACVCMFVFTMCMYCMYVYLSFLCVYIACMYVYVYLFLLCVCIACMYVYHVHSRSLQGSEESTGYPGTGVIDGCKLPCGAWELFTADKHHDQNQLEGKGVYFSLQFYIIVHHCRKSKIELNLKEPGGRN